MTEHWQQKRQSNGQAERLGQHRDGQRTAGPDENAEKYKQFAAGQDDRDARYNDDEQGQDEHDGPDEHGRQGRPNLVISVLSDKEPLSMNQRSLKSIVYDLVNAADEAKGKHVVSVAPAGDSLLLYMQTSEYCKKTSVHDRLCFFTPALLLVRSAGRQENSSGGQASLGATLPFPLPHTPSPVPSLPFSSPLPYLPYFSLPFPLVPFPPP